MNWTEKIKISLLPTIIWMAINFIKMSHSQEINAPSYNTHSDIDYYVSIAINVYWTFFYLKLNKMPVKLVPGFVFPMSVSTVRKNAKRTRFAHFLREAPQISKFNIFKIHYLKIKCCIHATMTEMLTSL